MTVTLEMRLHTIYHRCPWGSVNGVKKFDRVEAFEGGCIYIRTPTRREYALARGSRLRPATCQIGYLFCSRLASRVPWSAGAQERRSG